jgi:hypothetical protein
VNAPPGQKRAPQLVAANGGAELISDPLVQGTFASTSFEARRFVNFPLLPCRGRVGASIGVMLCPDSGLGGGGGRMPQAPSAPPSMPASALGIGCIRAALSSNPLKIMADIAARNCGFFDVEVYPTGVQMRGKLDPLRKAPELCVRGQILGFSDAAARRLKQAFMQLEVVGSILWSFTLTTHASLSPEVWRAIMKRFRCGVRDRGWAGIWRVELQRRGTPHLHVAFWLPRGVDFNEVRLLWLRCTREIDDEEARRHAVKGQRIEQGDGGWAVYMGLHSGKHKEAQLGWIGKQWGIWNVSAFAKREPVRAVLNRYQHRSFLRVVRRLETAARRQHFQRLKTVADRVGARFPIAAASLDRKVRRMARRLKVPQPHSRMVRLMKGATAERILEWSRGLGRSEPQSQRVARGDAALGLPF